jgi:peptidyl-prolyl cis-trans isomerase SurA
MGKNKGKAEVEVKVELKKATVVAALAIALLVPLLSHAKVINKVVAVVNNEVITEAEVERRLAAKEVSGGKVVDEKARRRAAIESLINDRLMDQILKSADIEVSEDDLARAIAGVLQSTGMNIEQLRGEIASKGMSWEDYRKEIENHIRRIKFINQVIGPQVKVTEQDIRDYYQRHQEDYRGSSKAHIAQIFLPIGGIRSQQEAEALRDKAISISNQARKGKSFKELARKHSEGPNSENGGDLGMVTLKDLPPAVAQTVQSMKVGDVSQPIFTEKGLIIVKLISLPELSPEDFSASRDRIYQRIYEERADETLQAYLQKERQKAFIEIR